MSAAARHQEADAECVVDGRYRLRREIARGGHGVVFEAEHLVTHQRVAIKMLLRAALDLPTAHARLLREARVLATLWHPNLIATHDAGVCSIYGPYLVLEMVEGRSLDGILIARQTLAVGQTLAVAVQLCAALHEAHTHGVVHRDIKPSNLLVTRADTGDRVKLIDFGIAKLLAEQESANDKLTKAGELIGTVEYVAPEQLMGTAPVDARADVYAVGVLLYECLSGEVPYSGAPTVVMANMLAGNKPRPLRARRDDVSPQLEALIRRAIEINPIKRFASVQELAAACTGVVAAPLPPLALLDPPAGAGAVDSPERRRAHVRAPYVTPVRVLIASASIDGRSEDLSEGGVLLMAEGAIDDGARVRLRLPLPLSGRVIEIEANTRWVKARGERRAIGAEFIALPNDVRAEIRSYVELMSSAKPTPASVPRN